MDKKYLSEDIELMLDFDYTKNTDIDPTKLTLGSNLRVWWICKTCSHSWQTKVNNRGGTLKRGCPECAKQKIADTLSKNAANKNNFQTKYPLLAKEWHPTKNGELKASDVSCCSEKKAWWLCPICKTEYKQLVTKRVNRNYGCPECAKNSTSFDEQAIFFYISQIFSDAVNRDISLGFEIDIMIPSKKIAIEYDGVKWHNSINKLKKDNLKDKKCQENNLALFRFRDPKLEDTIYATRITCIDGDNKSLEQGILELFALLDITDIPSIDITNDSPNIMSLYTKNFYDNSLGVKFPELAKEWHPIKNGFLKPINVSWSSSKYVWWLCNECGHEWEATPNNRTRKSHSTGCPKCSIKKTSKSNHIQIINLDTGIIYDSLTEAASSCNGRKSDICTCCNGKQKTAFGYRWAYINGKKRTKSVKSKVKNLNTGQIFNNSKEAALWCNGDNRNINKCCNKKCKTAYGYHWEYLEE